MSNIKCLTTLLCLLLAASVAADVRMDSLVVSPSGTRFRLNLINDGKVAVSPNRIELRIRKTADLPWQSMKLWIGARAMPPGSKLSLESTASDWGPSVDVLSLSSYQLQAVVSGPDVPQSSFNYYHGPKI